MKLIAGPFEKQKATKTRNCLTCARTRKCGYEKKRDTFRCQYFRPIKDESEYHDPKPKKNTKEAKTKKQEPIIVKKKKSEGGLLIKTDKSIIKNKEIIADAMDAINVRDPSGRDFAKMLTSISKSGDVIFTDPRVDDRDFPKAPNYFEWCTGQEFLASEPFPKQLQLGINFFAEWCPRCSDRDFIENIPFDIDLENLRDRVQMFEFGKCPRCKYTRGEAIADGELDLYDEITAVCGQRSGKCVHGNSWVLTPVGYVRMKKIVHEEGSTVTLEDGNIFSITKHWAKRSQKMTRLRFENGSSLQVTENHEMMTVDGYKPARKLVAGETAVPWHVGQNAFTPAANIIRFPALWPVPIHTSFMFTLEKSGIRDYEATANTIGQRIGEHLLARNDIGWLYSNVDRPAHKRELNEWLMVAPRSMLVGMFRTLFFGATFDYGPHLIFRYPSYRVQQQLQLLLANLGVFSRLNEHGDKLTISGRMALRLARICGAFDIPKVYLNKAQFNALDDDPWYDMYPKAVRNHIYKLFTRLLQITVSRVNALKVETGLNWNQEVLYKYLDLLKEETTRRNLRWVLEKHIKPLKLFLTVEGNMIVQNLTRMLDMDVCWMKLAAKEKGENTGVYDIEVRDRHRFIANGVIAHNSIAVTQLASYTTHRFLMLQDPSKYFGLLEGTILHGTAVATKYEQAKGAIWDPLFEIFDSSPWFRKYNLFLKERGEEIGEELYRLRDTYAYYRHRGLHLGPASSSKRSLRGLTRFWGTIDELGWFSEDDASVRASGLEVHKAMSRSLQTLRSAGRRLIGQGVYDFPQAGMFNISSPASINDPIMTLYNRSQRPGSKMYGVQIPTWEFNPFIKKEDLSEFQTDPEGAMRDFGAQPPMSQQAFINGIENFAAVISKEHINATELIQTRTKSMTGKLRTSGRINWNWADDTIPKLLVVDPGDTNNSFAWCVCHLDPEHGPIYDLFGEIIPKVDFPIDWTGITDNVLSEIIETMNVKLIASDRWQNKKLMQDLEAEHGIEYLEHRSKYSDFVTWKEGFFNSEFILPRPEMKLKQIMEVTEADYRKAFKGKPISHLIYQCLTVIDVPGKTVMKGTGATDDLFRCMVVAFNLMHDPEIAEMLQGTVNHGTYGLAAKGNINTNPRNLGSPTLPAALSKASGARQDSPLELDKLSSSRGIGALGTMHRHVK